MKGTVTAQSMSRRLTTGNQEVGVASQKTTRNAPSPKSRYYHYALRSIIPRIEIVSELADEKRGEGRIRVYVYTSSKKFGC